MSNDRLVLRFSQQPAEKVMSGAIFSVGV